MAPQGTFDYVGTVAGPDGSRVCTLTVRDEAQGRFARFGCLTGGSPTLHITDDGLTPDPGPNRPRVMRSRLLLKASGAEGASVAAAEFHVDRALVASLRAGDTLHLVRTASADLGISVLRDRQLVVAVGAVTCVPLGDDLTVSTPWDLFNKAQELFVTRDSRFHFREAPLQIAVAGLPVRVSMTYNCTIGPFSVFMLHGWLRGVPGKAECVAISRNGLCADVAARCSAMLLDSHQIGLARWQAPSSRLLDVDLEARECGRPVP
jgi:hypothetical protein